MLIPAALSLPFPPLILSLFSLEGAFPLVSVRMFEVSPSWKKEGVDSYTLERPSPLLPPLWETRQLCELVGEQDELAFKPHEAR